ncbi:DUF1657 domain-containing protein [Lihuaxuella thermophila]|uniref:DUF1657 domain-containing protein n=1 Tax=Lihuaxuella thermophila TaxID=1173111 RepID=A0A1H8EVG7_9BACL|nr:DUF1657 domain-containing protein [Lihuaxuella thermophila]SEN23390.1 Protein of unknown function [Lihuaxuella thermophila]
MTTHSKVRQTLACLEGAKATMDVYGEISQDEQARKIFHRNSQKLDLVLDRLKKRVRDLEFEEPQFKGF